MPFAGTDLQLPDSEEKLAFRALESVLKADATLDALVQTWSTWSGDESDLLEPSGTNVPFLGIAPVTSSADWVTEGQHGQPLVVAVLLAVQGTDVGQLMDFWACVRRAIFPSDLTAAEAVRSALQAARISKPTLTAPAFGIEVDKATGTRIAYAAGAIRCTMLIQT